MLRPPLSTRHYKPPHLSPYSVSPCSSNPSTISPCSMGRSRGSLQASSNAEATAYHRRLQGRKPGLAWLAWQTRVVWISNAGDPAV
eukprot:32224-Pelagomonas_calceolata.AAC.2